MTSASHLTLTGLLTHFVDEETGSVRASVLLPVGLTAILDSFITPPQVKNSS